MKFLFILIICLGFKNSNSQTNYIQYQKEIIKAEQLIMATQMKDALLSYKNTFDKYPKTFAKDAYIALQIACMVEDTNMISSCFKKSVENGIEWQAIIYADYCKNYFDSKQNYQKQLLKQYDIYRNNYLSSIDTNLRKYVLELLKEDDKARSKDGLPVKDSIDIVKWMNICYKNGIILDSLFKKKLFPGEHKVGLLPTEPSDAFNKKNIFSFPVFSRICYHNSCCMQWSQKELLQAVKDGEILPKEYALIYEWSYTSILKKSRWWDKYFTYQCEMLPHDKRYNYDLDFHTYSTDTLFVNQCRKEIGMFSVEHEKNMTKFADENKIIVGFGFMKKY